MLSALFPIGTGLYLVSYLGLVLGLDPLNDTSDAGQAATVVQRGSTER